MMPLTLAVSAAQTPISFPTTVLRQIRAVCVDQGARLARRVLLVLGLFAGLGLLSASAHADVPQAGAMAPEFSLPDQNGKLHQLKDYRGQWVVLYFYPKDDTPGCTQEACKFRDDLQALSSLGVQILGISVDDTLSHKKFAEKYNLPFPLLADEKATVAKSYGAITDLAVMKFAKRYTFLIDPQGKIAKTYLQVDTSRHSQEIIDDLKKLKGGA